MLGARLEADQLGNSFLVCEVGSVGGLDRGSSSEVVQSWIILEVEPAGLADELDMVFIFRESDQRSLLRFLS